jgi:hypothetical protein
MYGKRTLIIIFCNFIQQQLLADDFQIPLHRQAAAVGGYCLTTTKTPKQY